jgi:hypothetical protein
MEVQREAYRDIRADVPQQADVYDTETYRKAEDRRPIDATPA